MDFWLFIRGVKGGLTVLWRFSVSWQRSNRSFFSDFLQAVGGSYIVLSSSFYQWLFCLRRTAFSCVNLRNKKRLYKGFSSYIGQRIADFYACVGIAPSSMCGRGGGQLAGWGLVGK